MYEHGPLSDIVLNRNPFHEEERGISIVYMHAHMSTAHLDGLIHTLHNHNDPVCLIALNDEKHENSTDICELILQYRPQPVVPIILKSVELMNMRDEKVIITKNDKSDDLKPRFHHHMHSSPKSSSTKKSKNWNIPRR